MLISPSSPPKCQPRLGFAPHLPISEEAKEAWFPITCLLFLITTISLVKFGYVVVKDITIGAVSHWFDSKTGQVTTTATFLWSFVAQALSRGDWHATRYTLRRNTASVMKI